MQAQPPKTTTKTNGSPLKQGNLKIVKSKSTKKASKASPRYSAMGTEKPINASKQPKGTVFGAGIQ